MDKQSETYIIEGGQQGADRLKVLAEATWGYSRFFLDQLDLMPGTRRVLDVGCGSGEVTVRLHKYFQARTTTLGIDFDAKVIEIAKRGGADAGVSNLSFRQLDVSGDEFLGDVKFDLIYARFLLSHLKDPVRVLQRFGQHLSSDGIIAVEDVDFDGHFSHPKNAAFDQYVELYTQAGLKKGADPLIGPKLPGLFRAAGLSPCHIQVSLPTSLSGPIKEMALLTLHNIKPSLEASGLGTAETLDDLVSRLREFTADPTSLMSLPRVFQVSGRARDR